MQKLAIILSGSNMGNRKQNLDTAFSQLESVLAKADKRSKIYETSAWGKTDQPDFLNQVFGIYSSVSPLELLNILLEIEKGMGRVRQEKWGERTIDLDLLDYDNILLNDPILTLPHPGITQRRFVLIPLSEIYPVYIHPLYGLNSIQLLNNCTDKGLVSEYNENL